MGTRITPDHLQGLMVPSELFTADTLQGKGAGATDSDYTEEGPRPGIPVNGSDADTLVLEASGSQNADGSIEGLTRRAGHPGIGSYVWRDLERGDAADEYNGWDPFGVVTGIQYFDVDITRGNAGMKVIRLQSGVLLAVGMYTLNTTFYVHTYTPSTRAWTVSAEPNTLLSGNTKHALMQLPSGRVVWYRTSSEAGTITGQIDAWYSDDDGANWSRYGSGILSVPITTYNSAATIDNLTVAYSNGQVMMMTDYTTPAGNESTHQYASDDLGMTFTRTMGDYYSETGEKPIWSSLQPLDGAGFLWCYCDTNPTDHVYYSMRVQSSSTDVSNLIAEEIDTSTTGQNAHGLALWRDDDGDYWIAYDKHNALVIPKIYMARSTDAGQTWAAMAAHSYDSTTATEYYQAWDCEMVCGKAFLLGQQKSSLVIAQSLNPAIEFGGYGRHTVQYKDSSLLSSLVGWTSEDVITYGAQAATDALSYLPIAYPGTVGWTPSGAGTELISAATNGHLQITCTAAQQKGYQISYAGGVNSVFCDFVLSCNGGLLSADQVICYVENALAATYNYAVLIRFRENQCRIIDNTSAATLVTLPGDLTIPMRFRVHLTQGQVRMWYCRLAHNSPWTFAGPYAVSDGGGAAANVVKWGQFTNAARVQTWQHFSYCMWGGLWAADDAGQSTEPWANPPQLRGRTYSSVPQCVDGGLKVRAAAGPSALGDTWQIDARYDYPITNTFPIEVGSPNRVWRSEDDASDVEFVFDLSPADGTIRPNNYIVGLSFFNCNFRTVEAAVYTGAAWNTVLTLDAGHEYDSLAFTRTGSRIVPNSGVVTSGDRYIWQHELTGDTIDLGAGVAAQRYRKITDNTAGAWRGSGVTTKTPTIAFGGVTGSEVASGTARIWRKDFGGFLMNIGASNSKIRIKIPAQDTADGYFQIGTMVFGHVEVFGRQYDRGRSVTTSFNTETSQRTSRAVSVRSRGPVQRQVDFAWVTTQLETIQLYDSTQDPDYVVAEQTSNSPVAAVDTVRMMEGLLACNEGALFPMVYMPRIRVLDNGAGYSQLFAGRDELILGRFGDTLRIDAPLGDELSTETQRLNQVTLTEEV